MATNGSARRYAEAVFDLGRTRNTVEPWRDDLRFLAELLSNRRLAFVLSEPKVAFATKRQILQDLAATRVQPDALGLALLLVERDSVSLMPRIARAFDSLYDDFHRQAQATVTTAAPIDADEQRRIVAYLERITGKQVTIEQRVDPSILGGLIARVGDTLIDGSVKRRLALLRDQIASGASVPTR